MWCSHKIKLCHFPNLKFNELLLGRAAVSVAAQQRHCELSKGLVSRARMLCANSENNREPERARASKREPERAGEQARDIVLLQNS